MGRRIKILLVICCMVSIPQHSNAQEKNTVSIEQTFLHPPESAKPWVFWYWMHAAVSKAGITADLEAMKQVGIGGAYLMPIQDTLSSIPFQPTVRQLTPEWWGMVKFAMQEAKRLKLKLAMHVSDGFALAGGPWITPELSMQKLTWSKTYISSATQKIKLAEPESNAGYYKDVAVFAYQANLSNIFIEKQMVPVVTASNGTAPQFLFAADTNNKQSFKSDTACWIQYQYEQPFTCSSITIHTSGNNYEAQRLVVQSSDDGIHFKTITQLQPPRHGWQDTDEDVTSAVPATTAKYFRFVYNKAGSEPGAEDLDAAKWKPSFKVTGIYLSGEPVINQFESKNGSVWRVSENTTEEQVPASAAIPLKNIIDLSSKMDRQGNLDWSPPSGQWIIVRVGHTSTGHTNATGGAGAGLECDKFNIRAIKLQFDNWFAKAFRNTDAKLAKEVLKVFHVDSWECGSQNWSDNFKTEFKKRRGYDLMPYLLVMTGVPVTDAGTSEKVLHDVRETVAELVNDVFYATLKKLAHEKGCSFSAESVAPTMVSDGLLHYKNVDLPMGEFWLNSPTHDKPNDMLDAISGAHIYGKNIIGAESFTSVRMNWGEHPGNLKAIGDRNFALGINKMVLHVFAHNPWMDKKPGMTLDGVGLYFQRDQTWFKQSKAWIDYLTRCSALLQMGKPVVDIAVFTGEEVPRRSILPDRLVNTLPGIFGAEKVAAEKKRLENIGQPMRQIPDGVSHSANMADPENWIDPLNGYAYDSFNPDALMMMKVKDGRVVLPGGASYGVLIFPGKHPMQPNNTLISLSALKKIMQLVKDGAKIIMSKEYLDGIGLKDDVYSIKMIMGVLQLQDEASVKGKIIFTPFESPSFVTLGLQKDVEILNNNHSIAWTHRKVGDDDVYFIANQKGSKENVELIFRNTNKMAEIWNPVNGEIVRCMETSKDRTILLSLAPSESYFVVFKKSTTKYPEKLRPSLVQEDISFPYRWSVVFDKKFGGVEGPVIFDELNSWAQNANDQVKYYSGTGVYLNIFFIKKLAQAKRAYIQLDSIFNIATIKINGINCGTLWTQPYLLDITKALKQGENKIEIAVTNTWHNRLIGDNLLPVEKRITFTTAPFRLKDKPLLPAGLIGDVKIILR
ncbi:glycosyl hydrolase [Ferruginibacter profundus]